jgi:hypothetical protein
MSGQFRNILLGIFGVFCAAQLFQPAALQVQGRPVATSTNLPPHVVSILQRSCSDCHSGSTKMPWYAHVSPLSWMVASDVERGRKFLDFSQWEEYSAGKRIGYQMLILNAVKKKTMPVPAYVMMHKDSKLTDKDISTLEEWVKSSLTGRRKAA